MPPAHLSSFRALLGDEYDEGVCNVNYKVRADGSVCVFEVNARMGADLGCDVPPPMLRDCLDRLDALPPRCTDVRGEAG